MAGAYYNEIDPFAAHCLRALIADGVIAPGDVDERSIVDVQPDDLKGYTQCHFFAGGGLWSVAARMAGISDDEPIWTGSCPCQPFSVAGKRAGFNDERDLWPAFYRLIRECRPEIVFGEQVTGSDVLGRVDEKMLGMWNRETIFGISERLQRKNISSLQRMHGSNSQSCSENERKDDKGEQEVAREESRVESCFWGQRQGKAERTADRHHISRNTRENKCRDLRSDGHSFRLDDASVMELPFIGSDQTGRRIYARQYESRDLRLQRNVQHMGGTANSGCCKSDSGEAKAEIERLISENSREFEGHNRPSWLARVRADLGECGYQFGASILSAAGCGAPHIRQRLYWVGMADAESIGRRGRAHDKDEWRREQSSADPRKGSGGNEWRKVVYSKDCDENGICNQCGIKYSDCSCFGPTQDNLEYKWDGETLYAKHMVDTNGSAKERQRFIGVSMEPKQEARRSCDATYWAGTELVTGADGKARRVKPGVCLLADGFPGRVGQLRIAGNAIVPQVAAAFMTAALEAARQ